MKFFDLKRIPNSYAKCARQLWLLNPPKQELVFGNNTALFAVLASLSNHGKHRHPEIRIICPEFWLDRVHPYYLSEKWGQTKTGLPKIARDVLESMYPGQTLDDFLSLRQIQELRLTVLEKIAGEYQVPVYFGEPSIKKLENNQFEIKVKQKVGESTLYSAEDTRFYFWYRVPRTYTLGGVIQKSNTDIYQLHPSEIPENLDIVTLGGGLSVMWLAKHFANTTSTRKIICIKYKTDTLKIIPSNSSVDLSRIIVLDSEKVTISQAENNPDFVIVYSHEYQKEFRGVFYTSLGSRIPEEIVKEVDPAQVTSPSRWIASKWIAAKNVPPGSLMESVLQWFEITKNAWGFESQSYHETAHNFSEFVKRKSCTDLKIDGAYFRALEAAILGLDNPLPDEEVKPFLMHIYQQTYHPDEARLAIFSKNIDQLLEPCPNSVYNEDIHTAYTA